MNQMVKIDGFEVVLIEANHCPGAVQLRFDSFLNGFVGCDGVFLDTTYCNPKFVFPSQEESVDYVVM